MKEPIYLDNNATTMLAPQVYDAVTGVLRQTFGNPSSSHVIGQRAALAVASARRQVADSLNATPEEIVFTSGGTESDNLAILGRLSAVPDKKHLVVSQVEHEAVAQVAAHVAEMGYDVTRLGVDENGQLILDELKAALRDDTAVVSIMLANNETGVLFPIRQIADLCRSRDIPLHTDAVQAMGKVSIDVQELGVDLLSLSAHKFHGLKGTGVLYVRRGVNLRAQILGGHQEGGLRGGTEPVPGVVAIGAAAELVNNNLAEVMMIVRDLRDQLEQRIRQAVPQCLIVGREVDRLPNTASVVFSGLRSDELLLGLSEAGICASGGAACHSGALEPSGVLISMGLDARLASGAVRFSLSRYNTQRDVDRLLDVLPGIVKKLES